MPKVNQLQPNFSSTFRNLNNSVAGQVSGVLNNFIPNNGNYSSFAGGVNPADSRLAKAGLLLGGASVPKAFTQNAGVQFGSSQDSDNDWRVRISINPSSKILYWDTGSSGNMPGLVAPLKQTNGFIFPYVPTVTVTHSANYQTQQLTHSNYAQFFYESSSVAAINISGEFTVQNVDEARYFLAGLYFFRACTKMFYGLSSDYQGSPPPIVYLDGYGQHYLPHVPCVVTSFSHTMPNDVDYLEVSTPQSVSTSPALATTTGALGTIKLPEVRGTNATANGVVTQTINSAFNRVPTASTFSVTLQPVISRSQAINFDYKEFARGGLIAGKGSQYPGGYL
jgi:hypothetical protein